MQQQQGQENTSFMREKLQWQVTLRPVRRIFILFTQTNEVVGSSSIQFSLVFANVGGVTGVWPWIKVKKRPKIFSP